LNHNGHAHIGCAYLPPNGIIGEHEAVTSQLFLVVEGSGTVIGGNGERATICAGEAAYWEKGENHTTISESGLTAIIIEAENMVDSVHMTLFEPSEC
jgi:mannose-6-phosphate isomerase-like protein (cupin superfamily)